MTSVDDVGSVPHNSLLALIWACFGAAFLFVSLRTAIRCRVADRLSAEDYWMLLALATLLTLCILETVQLPSLYYVTGVLAGVIPVSMDLIDHTEDYLRFEFPIVILFWTVLWCVKAGFLALYFKLFRELPVYRNVWYALAGLTFLGYVGCVTTLCLSCRPITNFFVFAKCGGDQDVWTSNFSIYFSTCVDVFTDLCIMAMPLRLIYNVKVSLTEKIGLFCVFGLGFVMIAFAIIRAKQVLVQQQFVNLTLLMIWSTLAATISVVVGSLPTLRLFITKRAKRSVYGSSGGRSNKQASNMASPRAKSVPLSSVSSDKKPTIGRPMPLGDSQEDILRSDGASFVMVKHDVPAPSYEQREYHRDRPHPIYQSHRPISGYGRAF